MVRTSHYIWSIPLALLASIAISSAATTFQLIENVNRQLKSAWRFQITFVIAAILSIKDWYSDRENCIRMLTHGWIYILVSGFSLSLFFACWVYSLELTSLAHSLLFCDLSPIIIIIGTAIVQ